MSPNRNSRNHRRRALARRARRDSSSRHHCKVQLLVNTPCYEAMRHSPMHTLQESGEAGMVVSKMKMLPPELRARINALVQLGGEEWQGFDVVDELSLKTDGVNTETGETMCVGLFLVWKRSCTGVGPFDRLTGFCSLRLWTEPYHCWEVENLRIQPRTESYVSMFRDELYRVAQSQFGLCSCLAQVRKGNVHSRSVILGARFRESEGVESRFVQVPWQSLGGYRKEQAEKMDFFVLKSHFSTLYPLFHHIV